MSSTTTPAHHPVIDPLFLATPGVATFDGTRPLSNASGFFFQRDGRLYLATSRHVLFDPDSGHHPDRIEITLHMDPRDLTRCTGFSMLLYAQGKSVWHHGSDSGGEIDVAVVEIDRSALPDGAIIFAFTPDHLVHDFDAIATDAALCIAGFPLGFGDTLHRLPVLRHAAIASPFGIRFQGRGFFLTDARTHRGTSGAPVVMRMSAPGPATQALPWRLLGVHSARMDMGNRDTLLDESLGLNCAWYADILMALTDNDRS
jgi:hypothetical protein